MRQQVATHDVGPAGDPPSLPVPPPRPELGPPAPEAFLGFRPGTPRRLFRWPALVDYFRAVAATSDRVQVAALGPDSLGQPLLLLTISAPTNLARLPELREIQARLADPRRRDPAERDRLVTAGRCVCLVTCSIHGSEVGATQMSPELVHRLATATDEETRRVLEEVVLLLVPSLNPGGLELVAEWYARTLGTAAEGSVPPELYHPIAGHDNNRDWFMQVLSETRALVRHAHQAWHPQILFDLHQMQANGPRYVVPPYVDPYDPNVDPLLQTQTNALGAAIAAELNAQGKTGVASGVIFDAYSPSRAYPHYHGGVRILAEAASPRLATPIRLEPAQLAETRGFDPLTPSHNHPAPWPGGEWSLRDVIDYHLIATGALLDHAARYRDRWLRNFAIVQERTMARETPHAFVLPPLTRQRDPGATAELIAVLQAGAIELHEASAPFVAAGVEQAAGSLVVPVGQPFGGFAKTLLEIQRYPHLALHPGGPPRPPYDITAQTLGLQMGVEVVEATEPLCVPLIRLSVPPTPPAGIASVERDCPIFLIPAETTNAARLVNRLLGEGVAISRLPSPMLADDGAAPLAAGAFLVEGVPVPTLDRWAREAAVAVVGRSRPGPRGGRDRERGHWLRLRAPRIGLYRSWRPGAIDGGWTHHILEQYGFAPTTVRDRELRQGGLRPRFDAIVLPHASAREIIEGNPGGEYPADVAGGIGEGGAANLRRFVEEGGTLIALDGACELAISALYLPVTNVLERVRPEEFYCPGSLLRLLVDPSHPIAWGYERETAAMFVASPAFDPQPGPGLGPLAEPRIVARYPFSNPLLSGWILGPELLAGRAALVEVPLGRGRAILFGFRPQFRAQARATYRLLFNALYLAAMEP